MNRLFPLYLVLFLFFSCNQNDTFEISFHKVMNQQNLLEDDISDLSATNLRILRNTVFAQYGYNFQSEDLATFFYDSNSKPFGYHFSPSDSFQNSLLTEIDNGNVNLILKIEEELNTETHTVKNETSEFPEITDQKINNMPSWQVYYLLADDLISFDSQLSVKYDTELKRKHFPETEDYTTYKPRFDDIKDKVLNHYFIHDITGQIKIEPYDISSQGFYFLKDTTDWLRLEAIWGSIDKPLLTSLNGYFSNDNVYFRDIVRVGYTETLGASLFIPCTEDEGLVVENNIDKMKILMSFRIDPDVSSIRNTIFLNSNKMVKIKDVKYQIYIEDKLIVEKRVKDS